MLISYKQKSQLNPTVKVGDWFLFKYFTLIRIYGGFEDQPYQFLVYIDPRLFSLEFCRQRLITDHWHFISKRKKCILLYL